MDKVDNLVGDEFEDFDETDEVLDGKDENIDEDIAGDADIEQNTDEENIDNTDGFEKGQDSSENNEKIKEDEGITPPPADHKNKVVAQLDEVTKESEEKATQILDIMDEISENTTNNISSLKKVLEFFDRHKILCNKLHEKFPHIKIFAEEIGEINEMIKKIQNAINVNKTTSEKIFTVMDIMQYQDIHRQKIERVINIMRALIKYMNKLFESSVEDKKRVQSAKHIHGDETDDILSDKDIESLLDKFGV